MTTAVSHNSSTRRSPSLASAAGVGVFAIVVVAGLALQHHTPGQASPALSDPPVFSYPGSAVFDNQPAAPWWRHHNDLKRPGGSR
jgi:hypothetical protein